MSTVRGDNCPDDLHEHFLVRTVTYFWVEPVDDALAEFEARVVQRGKRMALAVGTFTVEGRVVGRTTGTVAHLNFAVGSKLQRKFSPLYVKRIAADWPARTVAVLSNYVEHPILELFRNTSAPTVAAKIPQSTRSESPGSSAKKPVSAKTIRQIAGSPPVWMSHWMPSGFSSQNSFSTYSKHPPRARQSRPF